MYKKEPILLKKKLKQSIQNKVEHVKYYLKQNNFESRFYQNCMCFEI